MSFVQVIEYPGADLEEVKRVNEEWKDATEGKRTAKRILLGRYREQPDRICEIVFFESHDDAERNNDLPETREYAKKLRDISPEEPRFFDLEVVDELML